MQFRVAFATFLVLDSALVSIEKPDYVAALGVHSPRDVVPQPVESKNWQR